ncbi:purine-nucleoside phosphorylase [Amaricoccus macauensis]|uniref:purine-nucleoside phosphorylase n=1 Tax=Amaricoccus macauensis TaxID=57001 RepID=UPI003C7B42D1
MTAADIVRERAGADPIDTGLILGSGLGHIAGKIGGVTIPYSDLPGFPPAGVSGHVPQLAIGELEGVRVAVLGGRAHYYEHGDPTVMRPAIETLKDLGVGAVLLTNAAGSLRTNVAPGDVMLIADHINFSGLNPLIGEATDARFVNMVDAYDPGIRSDLQRAATEEGIALIEGTYAWYSGPSFETPAEIRALGILGADAVGMSTVPEVILARFFGMKVAGLSVVTNMAAGLSSEAISHEHTKAMAPLGAAKLETILRRFLASRSHTATKS